MAAEEQQSSILKVTVLEHHPHYAMTALALGDQHLSVNKLDEPLQAALRIRIRLPMFLWFYNRRSKPALVTYCGQKLLIVMTTTARWKWNWKSAVNAVGAYQPVGQG
ncbi:hypothetical protein ACLK1T_02895 [Escherichia coli]